MTEYEYESQDKYKSYTCLKEAEYNVARARCICLCFNFRIGKVK